ncbi:MAG: pyrroloquinoline quinone biosynthesis protein PqqB [Chitinophagaceae bacterium]|nr:pyrroloquinoline quinone biosynthesis protein PqqB [Oligoflexus sp.]
MHIRVLGSAAGGGFPQWNCHCENCLGVKQGTIEAKPRTQSSIAVSSNGKDWVLINASPDIRAQILGNDVLAAQDGLRGTTIRGVVLIDAQLDHTSGLLFLREGSLLPVYCTETVRRDLTVGFPLFALLKSYCGLEHHLIDLKAGECRFTVNGAEGLSMKAIALKSKAPPYSPNRENPQVGDNIALHITDKASGKSVLYAPGLGTFEPHLEPYFASSDCVLVDGTFWLEDEMIRAGVGRKYASEMGHLYLYGEGGMIEILKNFPKPRKILIHINNTNPILNERSTARNRVSDERIEVAYDGMDIKI